MVKAKFFLLQIVQELYSIVNCYLHNAHRIPSDILHSELCLLPAFLYSVSHLLPNPDGWRTAAPCRNNQAQYRHTLQTHSFSFLTKRTYSCSNFVAVSSLVLELLKKCRVWQRVGHPVYIMLCKQCNITKSRQFWNSDKEFSLKMVQYTPKHVGEI